MKTVNNKINKSLVSIGFDKTGNITVNIDLNKTNKLNLENKNQLISILEKATRFIETSDLVIKSTNQKLALVNEFCVKYNTKFSNIITLDQLLEIEVLIKNNLLLAAIKKFKEIAGCGLREGKDFIEFYKDKIERIRNFNTKYIK